LQDYRVEKEPAVTQELVWGTLGEGLATIMEGYQDEEEFFSLEEKKKYYGIKNLQGSLTPLDSK
jgi:hypothetical protein